MSTLCISKDCRLLAVPIDENDIKIYDLKTFKVVYQLKNLLKNSIESIAFAPNQNYLAAGTLEGTFKIIDF